MSGTTIAFYAPNELIKRIRANAEHERRSISNYLTIVLDDNIPELCPQCGTPIVNHPDPLMTNVRYCPKCQEAVRYDAIR